MNLSVYRMFGVACAVVTVSLLSGCAKDPTDEKTAAVVNDAVEVEAPAEEANDVASEPVVPEGTVYTVDPSVSNITFAGSKVTGTHSGGWSKYDGTVIIPEGDFTKAHVTINIDMASTYSDDTDLTKKLVSDVFFEVDTYPTSTFVSTSIEGEGEEYDVSGNLTLHGITKNLTFPVLVELSDDKIVAEAEFSFNRKDFEVDYDGKADDLIRDKVLMTFYVEAKTE
jgi:polyisoprenoid-binding protein YceI